MYLQIISIHSQILKTAYIFALNMNLSYFSRPMCVFSTSSIFLKYFGGDFVSVIYYAHYKHKNTFIDISREETYTFDF